MDPHHASEMGDTPFIDPDSDGMIEGVERLAEIIPFPSHFMGTQPPKSPPPDKLMGPDDGSDPLPDNVVYLPVNPSAEEAVSSTIDEDSNNPSQDETTERLHKDCQQILAEVRQKIIKDEERINALQRGLNEVSARQSNKHGHT